MTFFGVGFRILIVALAVLLERIAGFLRRLPLEDLMRHPAVRRLLASVPSDLERHLRSEERSPSGYRSPRRSAQSSRPDSRSRGR